MPCESNPYIGLPAESYWRTGVAEADPTTRPGFYKKKFQLAESDSIATAGSCFAQHIGRRLKKAGFQVLDGEPPPKSLPPEQHSRFGYGIYSARYGNIYTVRQLIQLVQEAHGDWLPPDVVWQSSEGKYVDALRPGVEPDGLDSPEEVLAHRRFHLEQVKTVLRDMTVLVFTLGLTEAWVHKASGTAYPTAPGTIAGSFDAERYEFKNFTFNEVLDDLRKLTTLLDQYRNDKPLRYLLTVSPVPLTATASGTHVLQATVYSKSVLRAAAGQVAAESERVDYFPSFEIISNPWSTHDFYMPNKRSVRPEGVERVMGVFLTEHGAGHAQVPVETAVVTASPALPVQPEPPDPASDAADVVCDEELLEAFGPSAR